MFVEVEARSSDVDSRGKKTWVQNVMEKPEIKLVRPTSKEPGSPPWEINLYAWSHRDQADGSRGGEGRGMDYYVNVLLTPKDIKAIVAFVERRKLLPPKADPAKRRTRSGAEEAPAITTAGEA